MIGFATVRNAIRSHLSATIGVGDMAAVEEKTWECADCNHSFATQHGLAIHRARWCRMDNCTCQECGTGFFAKKSRIAKGHGRFCSRLCSNSWRAREMVGPRAANWKGGKVERICIVCGKHFFAHRCNVKAGLGLYCSRECKNIAQRGSNHPGWKGGPVTRTCAVCGHGFLVDVAKTRSGRGRYCSQGCFGVAESGRNNPYWKGGERARECLYCKQKFFAQCSEVNRGGGLYCSRACYGNAVSGSNSPRWKGGPFPYGAGWTEQRRRARNRDNDTCQLCGITKAELGRELSVHHIRPFRESADHSLENLICLCGESEGHFCHRYAEHHPEDCPEPRKNWLLPEVSVSSAGGI